MKVIFLDIDGVVVGGNWNDAERMTLWNKIVLENRIIKFNIYL